MTFLRQSTAATIKLGPFVDSSDGVTAETALTISQADVRLSKNGGDMAQKNSATSATHDEIGYYDVSLDTTDTNTLGRLRVMVSESGALPVWHDFIVLPANVYDSLIAGSDVLNANTSTCGRVLYVRKTGNDSNSGLTPSAAKLTVASLLLEGEFSLADGDVIDIGPGDYLEEAQLTIDQRVTLRGAGEASTRVTIDTGSIDEDVGIFVKANGVQFENLSLNSTGSGGVSTVGQTIYIEGASTGSFIDGVSFHRCTIAGGSDCIRGYFTNLKIVDCMIVPEWDGIVVDGANGTFVVEGTEFNREAPHSNGGLVNVSSAGARGDIINCRFTGRSTSVWTKCIMVNNATAKVAIRDSVIDVTGSHGSSLAIENSAGTVICSGTKYDASKVSGTVTSLDDPSILKPTVAGRTLDVTATGAAGIDWSNVENATATVTLSATTVKTVTDVEADTQDIQNRLPAALVGGRIDASVGAMASSVITAAATAADYVTEINTTVSSALTTYGALKPTVTGRTLDVNANGNAGIDWGNVDATTTIVTLSGTTVKTATDVETDTADIQNRLPAALTAGGNMKADVLAVSGDTTVADNIEGVYEDIVYVKYDGNANTSGTALRNAITGGSIGRKVYATRGSYDTGSTNLTFPTGVSLIGEDMEGVIIDNSLASGFSFTPGTLTTIEGVTLRNTSTGDVVGKSSGAISNWVLRNSRVLGGTVGVNFTSSSAILTTLENVIVRPSTTGSTSGIVLSGGAHELRVKHVDVISLGSSAAIGVDVQDTANVRGDHLYVSLPNSSGGIGVRVGDTSQVNLHDSNIHALTASINIADASAKIAMIDGEFNRSLVTGSTGQLTDVISPLRPTTAGRTLDVTSTGTAGVDWANVEGQSTMVTLSGTTVKTATDVETDTQNIQSRIPTALVGGRMDADVGAVSASTAAADFLEDACLGNEFFDVNVIMWDGTTDPSDPVRTIVDGALYAVGLDHLITSSVSSADVANNSIVAKLASKSATAAWSSYNNTTDSLEANRDFAETVYTAVDHQRFVSTVIGSLTDQTTFTLSAGSPDDDAYNGALCVLIDQSNGAQRSASLIDDYVGGTRTVTLDTAPTFTIATGDTVAIIPIAPGTTAPTAAQIADAVWDETATDHATAGTTGDKLLDAASGAGGGSGGPVEQTPVPEEFTWTVPARGSTNLAGTKTVYIQPTEKILCAMDFTNVLHAGDALSAITAVTEHSSQPITLTAAGVCGNLAKFWVEDADAAGSYRIECRVTTRFGLTLEGDGLAVTGD